jgi:protein MpaA
MDKSKGYFLNIIKKTYSKNNNEIILVEKAPKDYEKTILIIGVVHGDEQQGKFLIEKYLNTPHLSPLPQGARMQRANRLLFIPCLNPDGLENNTRQNANMVDINRNFPTKNWERTEKNDYFGGENSGSEIETKFVIEMIEEFSPDAILTLHAPYMVINYDGPAEEIAQELSKIINYPVQKEIGYPTPGSFGTYAGIERNIPTITLELDENCSTAELEQPINTIFDFLCKH